MSRIKLASLALLLAGATALPAAAQNARLADAVRDAHSAGPGNPRPAERARNRSESPLRASDARAYRVASDDRRESRGGRHGDRRDERRDVRVDRRDDRRDWRAERRDDRRDYRYERRDDRRDYRHERRDDRRDHRQAYRQDHYARHNDRRWNGYRWHPQYRYRAPVRYVYPRGYAARQWRVGHRLPYGYYDRHYYVDYRAYRLPPPPYGYHWVRVDRDVVLVALATGLIRDVLYGLYY